MKFIRELQGSIPRQADKTYKGANRFLRYSACVFSFVILITAAAAVPVLLQPVYAVQLVTESGIVETVPLFKDNEIYIDYIHSVALSDVREVFVITDNGRFLLTRTEYSSFGAGLPYEDYGSFRKVEGRYINSGINMVISEIPLRVGAAANHRLLLENGPEIVLSDFQEKQGLITIRPLKKSRLKNIISGGNN